MTPKKPRANPATKAEDADKENEDSEDRVIGVEGKGLKVKFPITQRSGEVLIYAISFAVVVAAIGLVIAQIVTAFKITGVPLKAGLEFVAWALIAFLSALQSRS
jgi:hypothetical protein